MIMKLRWKKTCTAVGIFVGCNLIAVTWAEARAREVIEERGLELGRQLEEMSGLMDAFEGVPPRGRAGGAHRLQVNGAEVALHSGSVRRSGGLRLDDLVERVRKNCRANVRDETISAELIRAPLIEWVGETEAFVYCLKTDRELSLEAISEMLDAFLKSGDLSQWGTFQGAYFRAHEDSVSILTAEIKRGLAPAKMFPSGRDAPGAAFRRLPKPPGRRVLSVGHNGKPTLNIHQSRADALSTLDEYHQKLVNAGLSVERAKVDRGNSLALVVRSPREAFVIVAKDDDVASHLVLARLPN